MANSSGDLHASANLLAMLGCVVSAKLLYDAITQYQEAPGSILIDPWESRTATRLLIAFLLATFGVFLKARGGNIITFLGCAIVFAEFVYWYYFSYMAFQNPDVGPGALANRIGLVGASWWHALAFMLALLLFGLQIYVGRWKLRLSRQVVLQATR